MYTELSFFDMFTKVWKKKFIIAVVLIGSLILSLIYNFLLVEKEYEAKSYVTFVNQSEDAMEVQSYAQLIKSDAILTKVINKLSLNKEFDELEQSIEVNFSGNSNVVQIIVRDVNSVQVVKIANMIAYETGFTVEMAKRSAEISESRKVLNRVNEELELITAQLGQVEGQLQDTPEKLTVKRSLSDDGFMKSLVESRTEEDLTSLLLETEELNPLYVDLKRQESELRISLDKLEAEKAIHERRITNNEEKIVLLQTLGLPETDAGAMALINRFNTTFITPGVSAGVAREDKVLNSVLISMIFTVLACFFVYIRALYVNNYAAKEM